jgi:peptidoglycan L-alanyl-D-glutamate endopeptidase CwlK
MENDIDFIIVQFHRTEEQQSVLYQQGRTKPGKVVTDCDGYFKKSKHQSWEAFDIAIIEDGQINWNSPKYDILGELWREFGGTWGIKLSSGYIDRGHFEI